MAGNGAGAGAGVRPGGSQPAMPRLVGHYVRALFATVAVHVCCTLCCCPCGYVDRAAAALTLSCCQQLGDEIGKGGFGTVFKGLNVKTGDFVAIKRMSLRNVDMDEIQSMQVRGGCCVE